MQLLALGLASVLGWEEQGYDEHDGGWEELGSEHGRWEAQQAVAGSLMGGWEVQQQPEYPDLQQQQNHVQQFDQQQYNQQQELYGQEKDQQYYAQFRAQIDQIQRGGIGGRFDTRYLEPKSYQGLQGRGVERDDQQRLFGSEREFGEPADPVFQFGGLDPVFQFEASDPVFQLGKEFGESDPMLHFGRDTISLGQPVAWEEARKRWEKIVEKIKALKRWERLKQNTLNFDLIEAYTNERNMTTRKYHIGLSNIYPVQLTMFTLLGDSQ